LPNARKLFLIGQFDGKFTVSHAARYQEFVDETSSGYYSLLEGANHASFGRHLSFEFDDIEVGNTENTILTSCAYILDLLENNEPKLNQLNQEAIAYWSPLYKSLHFERVYTDSNSDVINPDRFSFIINTGIF